MTQPQVFISYSRHDGGPYAERLDAALKAAGFRTWRDTRNINPNQDFTAEIETGIERSDVVAVCVTPDSKRHDSFVRREIQYALAVKKPAFPCLKHEIVPHASIINFEWLPFHQDWDGAFARLRELIADPNLHRETGSYEKPPDDPFKDYLEKLYRQIVLYLDKAVIRLIDLEAAATPEAVPQKPTDDIILDFFDAAGLDVATQHPAGHRYDSFAQAFDHHNGRLLLLGEPGAGKTITLMAHARDAVAARLGDAAQPLPVLKIAATWPANPPAPLATWAAGNLPELTPQIEAGRALLLLDGLDELGGEREGAGGEKYDPRPRFIDAVAQVNAQNRVLVTCRVKDYAAIGQKLPLDGAITLQPLSDAQLADYLADHPAILAAIRADAQLRELARTPLLLSLITFAWKDLDDSLRQRGDLQAGDVRDAIFLAYCKQVYEREQRREQRLTGDRAATLPFTLDETLAVLGELAMWNANWRRPGDAPGDQMRPEDNVLIAYDFAYVLQDENRRAAFIRMATRLSLLLPTGAADYRFAHLLLRDALAYTFALPRLRDADADVLRAAARALGRIGDPRAVEPLLAALGDPDARVRSAAARALGRIGDPRAVEPLLAALGDADEDEDVRFAAALALGLIGDPRAVEPLIATLGDADAAVRSAAAVALGEIGDPRAVEPLLAALGDADAAVRSEAAEALGRIGEPAVEPLIAALGDANARVRHEAAWALGRIGDPRAVEPLIAALGDANADVRYQAAAALARIGDPRAVEPLIAALGDADGQVRYAAAGALGKIGDPRAVEPLIAALRDAKRQMRAEAADALGRIGDPRAVEPLIAALGDANERVRRAAAEALGEIGDPRAVEPLIALLSDLIELWPNGPRICDYAYAALQKIGTAEALAACRAWVAAGNEPRKVIW